jgi:hypothetical protein
MSIDVHKQDGAVAVSATMAFNLALKVVGTFL